MSNHRTRNQRTPLEASRFPIGSRVRYKPGTGTYGYEDVLDVDGCVPGLVVGHTPTRVRVELTLARRGGMVLLRCVEADSLQPTREV